ncbi:MAG: serine hydrolase [Hyphomicrobiales bacterium]
MPIGTARADHNGKNGKGYFVLDNGKDLRMLADPQARKLLVRIKGKGKKFGPKQKAHYCRLKSGKYQIQWALNNLDTGKLIARSKNAEQLYFGASSSKLFVAAALLNKQRGKFSKKQLSQLVRMIVVSDNPSWLSLQKQTGKDGSTNSGRIAVQGFVERMGYPKTKGFQGWLVRKNGTREHGNELNSLELAQFLHHTYKRKYAGADVVWKIMQATRTGKSKAKKYTPKELYVGGKTGTYSGPNEAKKTVKLATIKARNHAFTVMAGNSHYGMAILSNTGSNEDVAIIGGGLMREYLGVKPAVSCK